MDQNTKKGSHAIAYFLKRSPTLRRIPGGQQIHYMSYEVFSSDFQFHSFLDVPCRAKLHHALTGLFYNWDWNDLDAKNITFEEAMMLKHVFTSQTEYKLWKHTLEQINKLGVEKAKEWLIAQVKVLTLRNLMKGK